MCPWPLNLIALHWLCNRLCCCSDVCASFFVFFSASFCCYFNGVALCVWFCGSMYPYLFIFFLIFEDEIPGEWGIWSSWCMFMSVQLNQNVNKHMFKKKKKKMIWSIFRAFTKFPEWITENVNLLPSLPICFFLNITSFYDCPPVCCCLTVRYE